ncbi:type II secretion system protein GspD [Campylobacter pinnipediorum]|uniref:type II secretion system protein GspD n=1 Tax=Campylobacter pinnipediorum TaxID=1965231 RepID=UPI0009953292|nr:type II and III secretion system protein [Campylobacter pinnipediorum]AQW82557.1 type II and III secretion system protein [Campylobacter pinnipediorum subsp. pinnipediorum]
MKKIFLILVCLSSFSYAVNTYINLLDLMFLTSKYNNVRIIADSEIDVSSYHFVFNGDNDKLSLDEFKKILSSKNLYIDFVDDLYIVTDKEQLKKDLKQIKFNNFIPDDVSKILTLYDINSTFITHNNTLYFRSDDFTYRQIKQSIKDYDVLPKSATFKLVITETNLNDLYNRGTDLTSILKPLNHGDLKLYVNLLTAPYMTNTNIIKDNSSAYFGVLNFLDENGITKIISSPFLTAYNDNDVFFSSVKTIPYLTSQSEVTNAQSSTTSSYQYKDVGLKISLKPVFLKDVIKVELSLVLEDLLNDTNTPVTSKKELRSSYFLKKGDVLVLSGINKTTSNKYRNGIPILKDIWLLKYLFSVEQEKEVKSVLTLSIEII